MNHGEAIECPECGEGLHQHPRLHRTQSYGEYPTWVEAAEDIPEGEHWRPRIVYDERKDGWVLGDSVESVHTGHCDAGFNWKGPHPNQEEAAKAACLNNDFTPDIVP